MTRDLLIFLCGSLSGGILFTLAGLIYKTKQARHVKSYILRIRRQHRVINLD